jgi:hypothetical protein
MRKFGSQPVPETEVRVNEAPLRHHSFELDSQASDVHVDRTIAGAHLPPPGQTEELLPRHDPIRASCQLCQDPQLLD